MHPDVATSSSVGSMRAQVGSTPVPDPTVLTTQQLQREIATARELTEEKMIGINGKIETRLDGVDEVIGLLRSRMEMFAAESIEGSRHLQELHAERFRSIERQLQDKDVRTEQASRESKEAIAAALQAQKEAVAAQNESNNKSMEKTEISFTKQIDLIGTSIDNLRRSFESTISDLKERVISLESQKKGAGELWGIIIAVIAVGVAIAIGIMSYRR